MKYPYVDEIIEVKGEDTIVIKGIGRPKSVKLSEEIVNWVSKSYVARRIIEELVTHYKFRTRLSHPGALRSLILLLYARARGEAPYKVAAREGVAHEQLYRMERGLKKDGLYDFVMNLLLLEA